MSILFQKMLALSIVCPMLFCFAKAVGADTITGKIEFNKRPPFAGVVYLKGKASPGKKVVVDQVDKKFVQKVAVGSSDSTIVFNNSASFDHNIFANDLDANVNFDVGLMTPGGSTEMKMDWSENTLVRIGCKIHPKMRAYIANIPSDHYQILEFEKKKKSYTFKLDNVPSNMTNLIVMIPKYTNISIDLAKGEQKTLDVVKNNKIKGHISFVRQ